MPPVVRQKATDEQIDIVRKTREGSVLVRAYAGAAKTTTAFLAARNHPATRVLCTAFNRDIVTDIGSNPNKPAKVEARTTNSLAFRAMRPNGSRLEKRLSPEIVVQKTKLKALGLSNGGLLSPIHLGNAALEVLRKFCHSSHSSLDDPAALPGLKELFNELPVAITAEGADAEQIRSEALRAAKIIWALQNDPNDSTPITHDTYFKQWTLKKPQLPYDLILFDEAQDTSSAMMDLMSIQDSPVLWAGDEYQQIYSWRGAINALDKINSCAMGSLTQSFRFRPEIADVANIVLRHMGAGKPMIGAGHGIEKNGHKAILCRTNGTAIAKLFENAKKYPNGAIAMLGAQEMVRVLDDIGHLMSGIPRGQFALFNSYKELYDYAMNGQGQDLRALISALEDRGLSRLKKDLAIAGKTDAQNAKLTISTVHRSKGKEWDFVELAGDFKRDPENKTPVISDDEENRLLYVACTRARVGLDYDAALPWLDAMEEASTGSSTPREQRHQQDDATHAPLDVYERIKRLALLTGEDEAALMNRCLDIGASILEKERQGSWDSGSASASPSSLASG